MIAPNTKHQFDRTFDHINIGKRKGRASNIVACITCTITCHIDESVINIDPPFRTERVLTPVIDDIEVNEIHITSGRRWHSWDEDEIPNLSIANVNRIVSHIQEQCEQAAADQLTLAIH